MAKKTVIDKSAQNEDNAKSNDDSVNEDEEPNFSDPEDFVDDIPDEGTWIIFDSIMPCLTRCYVSLSHSPGT